MLSQLKKIILFIGDLIFLGLSLVITILIRYPQIELEERLAAHWPHFIVIFAIWLLLFFINDLYNLNIRSTDKKFFRLTFNSLTFASLLSILYFYLNVQSNIAPKTNLVIFIVIFTALFFIWRTIFQTLVQTVIPVNKLALIDSDKHTGELIRELNNNPGSGYSAPLIFRTPEELNDLVTVIKEKNIKTIVIADDFGYSEKINKILFNCLAYQINFFNYPDFYELISGKIPVETIGPTWFLENLREGQKNYFNFFKILFDLCLASLIFLISLPLWPIFAIIIKLASSGSVLFCQERYGKDGKIFKIIKFRTMRTQNNDFSPTQEKDERVTSFGWFLRKTRLDEIPQVINILRGEMSFIGPRPERPEIVINLEKQIPFYKTRSLIKPGLTGWDQISGQYHSSSIPDSLEKLQYDLYYLKHRSFYLDLSIALRTLATIMSRSGR